MADKFVKVYCSLPHGPVLELNSPVPGKPASDNYQSVELVGVLKAGPSAKTLPSRKGEKFGLTLVPAEFWEKWLAKNKTLRLVIDKSIVVA